MDLLNLQDILDEENSSTITENGSITANRCGFTLKKAPKWTGYRLSGNNLLKSSIKFLKIE
jgi:hypothetical protein